MKTQIQFTRLDGDHGVALIPGPTNSLEQAKQELANKLDLPDVHQAQSAEPDVNARLRNGGIDPDSVTFDQLSE